MFRKALVVLWVTCVCATLGTTSTLAAAATDIVLYAGDATNLHGNWSRGADASAAGGQLLTSADKGWSNTGAPLASPADSFDFTFTAPAATSYHVWLRMRAGANSKYNDSVYVQLSDAVDGNGAALYTMGTRNGLTINLATNSGGGSLGGWGWQDGAYWLTQPTTVRFASSGTHTLRIQTREDGVQIDQVVLGAGAYVTSAPGQATNDATIVPKPMTVTAFPAPWANQDVGGTGLAGSASLTAGTFTVAGSGSDIWGTTDGFQFVSQPVSGDTQIVARVATTQNTGPYAKAGVMLRESTAAGAAHVLLDVRPNGSIEFMSRPSTGAATSFIAGGTLTVPGWLKLTRSGSTVTGFVSANGIAWSQIGASTIAMTTSLAGLAVTSHDTTLLNTSTFDNVLVGLPPAAPSSPTPTAGAIGVGAAGLITWSAVNATSYDVAFGTANPPAPVAANLSTAAFAPTGLTTGTTYYWQVTARNTAGATAGPVWSFTTLVAAPGIPTATTPVNGATGVATNSLLAWTAANATSYDVAFGTTNPPPSAAANLSTAALVPTGLTTGTTYYWQVTARNAGGTTVGPIASFATVVAAPGIPTATTPVNGATGVAISSLLAWTAANATSYDVAFGTANPPAPVATGLSTAAFAPAGLTAGTTYYWQVTARNEGGASIGSVWSFTAGGIPTPWQSQDVGLVGLAGSASYLASTNRFTVAGAGADIWGQDDGFQFVSRAVSGDTEIVVRVRSMQNTNAYAKAGIMLRESPAAGAAHVILDMRPNGSVEFMMRPSTGAPTTFIAGGTQVAPAWLRVTRNGGTVTAALSADGSTWTSIGSAATTLATNAWTGLVVTSHDTSQLATAEFDNVAVTLPVPATTPPGATGTMAPTAYNAIADRNAYAKPALPLLGAAGYSFNDPTFGSKIIRVTDGHTRPDATNRSYRAPSNSQLAAWNASSTAFIVVSSDGTIIPYTFDPATLSASRLQPSSTGSGGLTLPFYVEPQFSLSDPNLIYGAVTGTNNRTIVQFDFKTAAYTTVVDLDTIVSGLAGTYIGNVMTGGTSPEKLITLFGAASQDSHYYVMWTPVGNMGARKILNTKTSTINGVPTNIPLNFLLHSTFIDKSGRFVFLGPRAPDLGAPRNADQVYVWDTDTDTIAPITSTMIGYGHGTAGYGAYINQDCCTSSTWDAAQWQFRLLTDLSRTSDLISPVPSSKEVYLADHSTWNNAQPSTLVPVISSTYRYGANTTPWRAWDDEIIGIDTTGGIGGIVYRFAHHRSTVASDTDPTTTYFWYQPIANVSPNGQWVIFTSNWEKTLGTDSPEGTFRQDVFMVHLTPQ